MIRESLEDPANLRAFLRSAVPDLADGFDCARAVVVKRELITEDWRGRESDVPLEVPYRIGSEEQTTLVYVLVEHQSDTEVFMPLRTLTLTVLYWDRQWQLWTRLPRPRPPLRLNPVLPIVLYTGATPWGSNRTLRDLLGEPSAFHAFAPTWQPLFWNLADRAPAALLGSGEDWLQLMAVIRAGAADAAGLLTVVTEAMTRLGRMPEQDEARWQRLVQIILDWVHLRRAPSEWPKLLAAAVAAQPAPRQQRVQTMVHTIADELRLESALNTARLILRSLLQKRFGPLPEALAKHIDDTRDVARLQDAVLKAADVARLEDFAL
jgi:hypothetical protein